MLDIEHDEAGRPPSESEIKQATYDLTAEDEATRAKGQAVMDRENAYQARAKNRSSLRREALSLEEVFVATLT